MNGRNFAREKSVFLSSQFLFFFNSFYLTLKYNNSSLCIQYKKLFKLYLKKYLYIYFYKNINSEQIFLHEYCFQNPNLIKVILMTTKIKFEENHPPA